MCVCVFSFPSCLCVPLCVCIRSTPLPPQVPGVTSMSVDVHKFGCAPKGSSVVLYRSNDLRHAQYHSTTDFAGPLPSFPLVTVELCVMAGSSVHLCFGRFDEEDDSVVVSAVPL